MVHIYSLWNWPLRLNETDNTASFERNVIFLLSELEDKTVTGNHMEKMKARGKDGIKETI